MWTLVRHRLLDAVLVVWLVGTVTFVLLQLAPGDPVSAVASDPRVSPAVQAELRRREAFDQPWPVQYLRYAHAVARLDLGYSYSQRRPVVGVLRETLPHTLLLMGLALAASVVCGVALGTWQAARADSRADHVAGVITGGLAAIPDVWLATMLLTLFAVHWPLFPLSGRCDPLGCGAAGTWAHAREVLHHAALPVATLTLLFVATFSRMQRAVLRPILADAATRTAHAKGMPASRVLVQHGLRRALRPTITDIGLSLPALVGGAVLVEQVFGWPGLGQVLVGGIGMRDYPLVTAGAMAGGVLVVCGRLLADLANAGLDPRLRPSDA